MALCAPRLGLALVLLACLLAAMSATRLGFGDEPRRLYAPATAAFAPLAERRFRDPADLAILLTDDDTTAPGGEEDAAALRALDERLGRDAVLDRGIIERIVMALPEAAQPGMFVGDADPAIDLAPDPTDVETLARALLGPAAGGVVLVAPDAGIGRLAAAQEIVGAAAAAAPDATLTGLPIARLALVDTLIEQQPLLLAGGLAVGFVFGVMLLGRVTDALVIAVTPVLSILWIYGAFGVLGIEMTVLVNNLPLLVLALSFSASIHLVHSARADLESAGWDTSALRAPCRRVGGPVVLSMLTTALAFTSFGLSGSAAIVEFGVIGALAVLGVMAIATLVAPVVLWAALAAGWRPTTARRSGWPIGLAMEAAGRALARRISRHRRGALAVAAVLLAGAAMAAISLDTRHAIGEDLPAGSATVRDLARAADALGGGAAITLPLPIRLGDEVDIATLAALRRAHEAAARVLPDAHVVSPHSLLRWLADTGRMVTRGNADAILDAMPARHLGALIAADGQAALVARVGATTADGLAERVATLEQGVGAALGSDLSGTATGLAASLTRGPDIVANVALGLAAAAVGAAVLAAIAFGDARIFLLTLVPNLTPILLVLALLFVAGRPLELVSAMALTVALGIAVDNTVHVAAAYRRSRARLAPEAALGEALGEQLPILVTSTLVLCLGLAPAFWSWSPAISVFAVLAVLTLGFGLLADLLLLPVLIAVVDDGGGGGVETHGGIETPPHRPNDKEPRG